MKDFSFLIIIPCEKYSMQLQKTLDSIFQQTYVQYKTVVILSYKTKEKFPKTTFIYAPETRGQPSLKRNFGLKKTSCPYLLFLDDDIILSKNWLKNAFIELKTTSVSAVVGPLLTPPQSPFWERVSGYIWESSLTSLRWSPQKLGETQRVEVVDYPCAAFAMKTIDFQKLVGFNKNFHPGEDTKLCLDITHVLHKKIMQSPNLLAYHRRKPFLFSYIRQISRYAKQRGRFARLFPLTSLHYIYILPSLFFIYILFLLSLWLCNKNLTLLVFLPCVFYFLLLLRELIIVFGKSEQLLISFWVGIGIVLTHLVYGFYFLIGFVKVNTDESRHLLSTF